MDNAIQPAKRGRPPTPLAERLAPVIDQPISLEGWPDKLSPCWHGPARVMANGKVMTTKRALLQLVYDREFHESWRVRAECPYEDPYCINPHHHVIEVVNVRTGTVPEPLPALAIEQIIAEQAEEDELPDVIAFIESDPVTRKAMTATELQAACLALGTEYDLDLFERALASFAPRDP